VHFRKSVRFFEFFGCRECLEDNGICFRVLGSIRIGLSNSVGPELEFEFDFSHSGEEFVLRLRNCICILHIPGR